MRRVVLALLLIALCGPAASAENRPFIAWKGLRNPVLSYPGWSIKDAAMAYRDGTFYIFFSAFYQDRGRVRSHVVEVSTKDFRHFSQPIFDFDGRRDGWIGMCSPDVQKLGGEYVMTFNSWGADPKKPNQLFYRTSQDLVHWSARQSLAPNLTKGLQVIDAALSYDGTDYHLIYKQEQIKPQPRPRIATSRSLDGPYQFSGNGFPSLLMKSGSEDGLIHENYEFIRTQGTWYLLTTDYHPQAPYLYTLLNGSRWLKWINGYKIVIPEQKFNTDNIANAAALYDWRKYDGYYYLIYAGRTEGKTFLGRGWNQLGLARSKDLIHWLPAGRMQ